MNDTQRLTRTPPGLRLCVLHELANPGARGFSLQLENGRFQGFVVRTAGKVHGFVDECPHMGLPLARISNQYLTPNSAYVECSHHGAVFEPSTGVCIMGPCAREQLTPWPVSIEDGVLVTGGSDNG